MADLEDRPGGDPEEEDDEVDDSGFKTVKDAVLFAIEVSETMLAEPPPSESRKADHDSPSMAALKCAYHMMQKRIISNPKDMLGILLYGTEPSKFYDEEEDGRGGLSYPHCYLLTDLDVPDANDVRTLKELVEGDEGMATDLLKPSKERVSMSNVLFCANQIFTTKAPNFSSRRLFLVTDDDNPHGSDKGQRNAAVTRAKDLYDLGVVIELFPISTLVHEFNPEAFYDDIIYRSSPADPEAPAHLNAGRTQTKFSSGGDGLSLLSSLISDVNSKSTPRRALFSHMTLEFNPDFKISVKGYLIMKPQKPQRSCYVYLEADKPLLAKGRTTQQADESARHIEKHEIRKAYRFGGEPIPFTPDEISQIRNFGDPVIRILGFKPLSSLPIWATTKYPTYLYPSEEDFVGSTRVFSALFQKLRSSKLYAMVWFIARRNATPVIAALIPTLDTSDPNNSDPSTTSTPSSLPTPPPLLPTGLYLHPLPFADDIRAAPSLPSSSPLKSPDSLTTAMVNMIEQLHLPGGIYDPSRYPNPALQWHYRILQALALEEDVPTKPEDKTVPKYRQIDKRAGRFAVEWGEELKKAYFEAQQREPDYGGSKDSTLAKRPAPTKTGGGTTKRMKMENGEGAQKGPTDKEMRRLWEKKLVGKLTVPELKGWLGGKRVDVRGKKGELVEKVERWFENQ
ncbi:MAG: hypothetical protein Q9227_003075 [Pyrenula ochraceoflavens]